MSIRHINHRCVGKAPATTVERQPSLNSTGDSSQKKPDESRKGSPTFMEEFLSDHCRFDQHTDLIEFVNFF